MATAFIRPLHTRIDDTPPVCNAIVANPSVLSPNQPYDTRNALQADTNHLREKDLLRFLSSTQLIGDDLRLRALGMRAENVAATYAQESILTQWTAVLEETVERRR